MDHLLEVHDLACGYDTFHIQNINFNIKKGDFFGIIGPNGSGKTTLLRALTKILKLNHGYILIKGNNLHDLTYRELAQSIAVVSQNPHIPQISIEDFVAMGRIPFYQKYQFFETRKDHEIVERSIQLTGIESFRKRFLSELSGGERQMACIARALCQEPQLLLLDEPTTFLDITHQVMVLDLIKRLNRTIDLTVVMVIHDLNLASAYCEKLLLMDSGKLHSMGSATEVLTYETIEAVFNTIVVVKKHPFTGKPNIFLVTEEDRNKLQSR